MLDNEGLGIETLLLPKRSQIIEIAEKHGAFNDRVFGSVARGEAARSASLGLKNTYSAIPWTTIAGFRNLVVHKHFRVDFNIVWDVVDNDLPILKPLIEKALVDLL